MKTKVIRSGDFSILVFVGANPMIINNSSKNWPKSFATSFKLERVE